jgi:hypothetical protein
MSNSRIDPTTTSVQVAPARARETEQSNNNTAFSSVLNASANALVAGASVVSGVVGGPVLAAAVREAGGALVGAVGGSGGGGAAGTAAGVLSAGSGGSEMSQMHAMQRESQAFNLQLLNLQQEVQDENRRFTTLSNCLKAQFDTAKSVINNART